MTLSLMLSAVIMALVGSGHCASMCGPLAMQRPDRKVTVIGVARATPSLSLLVHAGRIATYAALGALTAAFSATMTQFLRNGVLQTAWLLLPNFLLLLSALYLMGFQRALSPAEQLGRIVWRSLTPIKARFANGRGAAGALLRGALWGLVPCGMIYSALGLAVLAAHPLDGALVMAAFGGATLPVLLAIGLLSARAVERLQRPATRRVLGAALLSLVLWNMWLLPDRLNGVRYAFLC